MFLIILDLPCLPPSMLLPLCIPFLFPHPSFLPFLWFHQGKDVFIPLKGKRENHSDILSLVGEASNNVNLSKYCTFRGICIYNALQINS